MLKQIILIRHGKVNMENSRKINALDLHKWVKEYDAAPLCVESVPNLTQKALVQEANVCVTSTLSRAIDSAKLLELNICESNMLFNEAQIPHVNIPFLHLKPKSWLIILRVLLIFGLGKKDDSLKKSKNKAIEASKILTNLANKHASVVLVGHGGMNWLIRKVLMKEGWNLKTKPSNTNWGMTILTY